jgi:hypothetical protein
MNLNADKLVGYRQAIDDVRSLRKATGGINLDEGDIAITPEVGTEILERHVNEVQTEINALEDLARRHDIPPGTLRGREVPQRSSRGLVRFFERGFNTTAMFQI